ncbi:hypothetical protein [Chryseolinea lacunae]|uniref:Uncharacterized protein n=1 Tax=Chryseolinea lacunae TaxID=2801331 RepID=A0ABS1KVE9_9BACT|nr:hypothetical protein [Chryseolinea lacunae]MBL0742672.1 hypothetical protein [Chryseolinea lacunae]
MKTVRTSMGVRKIEDWNANLIPLQLREILQEQRKALVERMLVENGLQIYAHGQLGIKLTPEQNAKARNGLIQLMNAGIDINNYQTVLEMVLTSENSYIDSAYFYREIDHSIHMSLQESQLRIPHFVSLFG